MDGKRIYQALAERGINVREVDERGKQVVVYANCPGTLTESIIEGKILASGVTANADINSGPSTIPGVYYFRFEPAMSYQ